MPEPKSPLLKRPEIGLVAVFVVIVICVAFIIFSNRVTGVTTREPLSYPTEATSVSPTARFEEAPIITLQPGDPRLLEIESAIAKYESTNNENVYLYFEDESRSYSHRAEEVTRSASTIKITVMMEVYRQLESGQLLPSTYVSRYSFSGTVDSALKAMMHSSNNSATGALIKAVGGTDAVNTTIDLYLGENAITTLHHTPGFYSEAGAVKQNVTTAREQVRLIELLDAGMIVTPEHSKQMLELMSGTRDYFGIRSINGIESIAFKTGYFPNYLYGLTGQVNQSTGESYRFSIYLEDWDNNRAKWSGMRELLTLLEEYATIE